MFRMIIFYRRGEVIFIMNNTYDRCPNCMNPYDGSGAPCPYCGQDVMGYNAPVCCLPPFTILQDKYMVGRVLGQGGFGITYIGYDMNLATYVAIKEYYPESISTRGLADNVLMVTAQSGKDEIYNKNLNRFVEEARNLSKFYSLPGIVSVRNFFYENGTAYIVMDYVAGENLKKYLADNGGRLDENTVLALMKPVLESLYEIHNQGLIHRDISPDNIMFDDDGSIKLIDFGAVRGLSTDGDMTYTVMLKHGYAPQEQYFSKGKQGPWTDIYSLCATMYKMLTGNVPPNCIERMSEDSYVPPSWYGVQISPLVEQALSKGLAVNIADRYQNIGELIKDLYGKEYTFMGDGQIGVNEPITEIAPPASKNKNKKLPIIIVSSLAALTLLFVCLKVFVLGGDRDKVTTENAIEPSTASETTTEMPETTEATTTEEVVRLEGDWSDFKFMVDDELHQLPMTYDEWIAHGWVAEMEKTVESGETVGVRFHNDKMTCTASLANYGTEPASMSQCYVVGFSFDYDFYASEELCTITLPGGIDVSTKNYRKSDSVQETLELYGEADYENLSEYFTTCRYRAVDGSYLILWGDENGAIYSVDYFSYVTPEGAAFPAYSATDTVPYNEAYEAPGTTTDRFDDIFCIDGVNYKMYGPASQYVDNGWSIECEQDKLNPGYTTTAVFRKGDASFNVTLLNTTLFTLEIPQTKVVEVQFIAEECQTVEVIFPGGARMGGNTRDITTMYSDIKSFNDSVIGEDTFQTLSNYGVYDGSISIYVYGSESEAEKGVYYINEYKYERTHSAAMTDLENQDYIQGITVDRDDIQVNTEN